MERTTLRHTRIIELERQLQSGNSKALEEFWNKVDVNGAPLIENILDDDKNQLVTIIYREKKELNNVVLIPPVGMRKLENCKMDKLLNTNLWYISYIVRNDVSFTYQFVPNDPLDNDWNRRWKNVQADEFNDKNIIYIDSISRRKRFIPFVEMKNVQSKKYLKENCNCNKGILYDKKIYSEKLQEERTFKVYEPYGYNENKEPYGILVLNDGFEYVNMLSATNVLDNLIEDKIINPIICVFIDSTSNRGEDLKCNDDFTDFIGNELISYMNENYNVSSNPKKNIIGGYSLGGLAASYLGLKYSSVFGNVLSQSGSYWYARKDYKNEKSLWICDEFSKAKKLNLKFYINVGAIEPKISMIDTNIKFKNELIDMGYKVKFEKFGSGHDFLWWGETLANGLIYLVGI